MKFSFGTKSKIKTKNTMLFVCVENAGRSQMAEGFFGDGIDFMDGGGTHDFMNGQIGNEVMFGLFDNDNVIGEAGDDILAGGSGQDRVSGGSGNDNILGLDGDDGGKLLRGAVKWSRG
jgi:Ca2+-binding RTX toxin-like protein